MVRCNCRVRQFIYMHTVTFSKHVLAVNRLTRSTFKWVLYIRSYWLMWLTTGYVIKTWAEWEIMDHAQFYSSSCCCCCCCCWVYDVVLGLLTNNVFLQWPVQPDRVIPVTLFRKVFLDPRSSVFVSTTPLCSQLPGSFTGTAHITPHENIRDYYSSSCLCWHVFCRLFKQVGIEI